jgi:hypothetical protein
MNGVWSRLAQINGVRDKRQSVSCILVFDLTDHLLDAINKRYHVRLKDDRQEEETVPLMQNPF